MTKHTITISKVVKVLPVAIFVASTFCLVPTAEARQGCKTGYHPNPYNPAQCVANGTTGLGGKCDPGQHRWYDPRTKQWNPC
ncbi:hypothetical protein BN59_01621 [Legionella massiliensis]|uniref:Secreted protein n=1 Tax=Legionella massiliensis TaxID=1034943 RepID=A0A078KZV5_9GAMM|nr:hypothetical protein [Legionella massiliensis]CDZ77338.1 hypothetical protein BN59_01621 [Legionella massiliensis]CEE13076.1 hypothetical protein BN1094_01621 [Legionella massiliensis]